MNELKKIFQEIYNRLILEKQSGKKTLFLPTFSENSKLFAEGEKVERVTASGKVEMLGHRPVVQIASSFREFREKVLKCERCALAGGRTQVVFGTGNEKASLLFVGEAPGFDEDRLGEPFVGKAGQLLTKMIEAMGLKREDVYIANIIKCRPPNNRTPEPSEIEQCYPYLLEQIRRISPKVICALGNVAAQTLLGTEKTITRLRGLFQDWNGIKLMPTFHPSYLLRNPEYKREVWRDLQWVMKELVSA
ncbi:MAG: uracil-DNA glycosylase [Chlamydiae bacterium]|nr:uracil-DNA glycosylase [Chlamydiota bacterium]MBI3265505.1 uracil-DNA glycosylase [Chlamydiota bacterium]